MEVVRLHYKVMHLCEVSYLDGIQSNYCWPGWSTAFDSRGTSVSNVQSLASTYVFPVQPLRTL